MDGIQAYHFTCQLEKFENNNKFCQELGQLASTTLKFCRQLCVMTKGAVKMNEHNLSSSVCDDSTTSPPAKKRKTNDFQDERERILEELPEYQIGTHCSLNFLLKFNFFSNFIGVYDIPISQLREPPQYLRVREVKQWYVEYLVQMLSEEVDDHEDLTAPLLVLASVTKAEFHHNNLHNYSYEVCIIIICIEILG